MMVAPWFWLREVTGGTLEFQLTPGCRITVESSSAGPQWDPPVAGLVWKNQERYFARRVHPHFCLHVVQGLTYLT